MSFHINGNLSPTEAVNNYEQLQVHPVIEEWAEKAEKWDSEESEFLKLLDKIIDKKLKSAEQIRNECERLKEELFS